MRVRFNPRLPGGRRQQTCCTGTCLTLVSIHAFRGEGDGLRGCNNVFVGEFQSTPSRGKATYFVITFERNASSVSIHAFRGEGDEGAGRAAAIDNGFNPRLPGGRRRRKRLFIRMVVVFQSTPSGGKATTNPSTGDATEKFQSTPSGGKATDDGVGEGEGEGVSIHAFRGEGDPSPARPRALFVGFQSTPSGGKATDRRSVRAPGCGRFNPRLPGGRRPTTTPPGDGRQAFQSTPSGGKATCPPHQHPAGAAVSIHAFRGEGDVCASSYSALLGGFNPRLPGGRRRQTTPDDPTAWMFQSTPSGGKATSSVEFLLCRILFQSTPSGGKATR